MCFKSKKTDLSKVPPANLNFLKMRKEIPGYAGIIIRKLKKEEKPMLEMIMAFFKGAKFAKLSSAMAVLSPMLQHLEDNYAADKDAKNAVIDTMIQILQAHKDK